MLSHVFATFISMNYPLIYNVVKLFLNYFVSRVAYEHIHRNHILKKLRVCEVDLKAQELEDKHEDTFGDSSGKRVRGRRPGSSKAAVTASGLRGFITQIVRDEFHAALL